ncbi:MAG: large subunit ribosomal protein [Acidimicrobiaceae bacterium]
MKKVDAKLNPEIFGVQPNIAVMHQVVTAQLAARRAGSQHTKTRAQVRGGGAKPWRQKGTGRARQGSIRAPHWRGGGVALGPSPRSYAQRTPKKMVRLALCSALSDRAADDKVIVIDSWGIDEPKTKDALAALDTLKLQGKLLLVLGDEDDAVWKSFRNLGDTVHCLYTRELNAYDVLVSDYVVFTKATLPGAVPETETAVKAPRAEGSASDEAQSAEAGAQRRPEPTGDEEE